jgi:adenylylsulfate kinase
MKKTIVLIQGLPGSGKTTLADILAAKLGTARVNADYVRNNINTNLGFSPEDRIEQARRMAKIASVSLTGRNEIAVVDFVCPTPETRKAFSAGAEHRVFNVWMDTIQVGRFEDTNKLYVGPALNTVDYTVHTYLSEDGFSLVADEIALQLAKIHNRKARRYYLRYNTQVGDTDLRWRVIDAETKEERLAESFRIDDLTLFPISSIEHGEMKWNVGVDGVAVWVDNSVFFK